jgi:CheY-like chemotaxis protein
MPRILVVDDSATVRKLVRVHLKGRGYHFEEAANGAEGLKALAKTQFDLIICDLMMPVMDGIQMLRMKDSLHNTTPVILLTAEVSDTLEQAMSSPCVMDYLKKPLDPGKLNVVFAQALSLAATEEATG